MEKENILMQIKKQKLTGRPRRTVASRLSDIYSVNFDEINKLVYDLETDGELFTDKKGNLNVSSELGYQTGTLNGNSKGFCFCVFDDKTKDDVFVANANLNGAMHSDRVLIKVQTNDRDGRSEGVVVKVLKHGLRTLVGTIQVYEKFCFVVPDNKKIFKDVYIKKADSLKAKTGDKVFVQIDSFEGKSLKGSVIEILGSGKGDINTDVLSIVRSYELIEEFSKELLNSAKSLPQSVDASKFPNRLDLRNEIIFTIDGDDTKDFDDAVSLTKQGENYILGVHIADVGEYVKAGSKLDDEAFERGTSVYFPNAVLPMLPKELSNGICSLNPHEDRLTLSCICKIDKNGKILEHKICESIINSCERMTYANVTKIIDGDKELNERYQKIVPTLMMMAQLNEILEENRRRRGEINFDIPEAKIILDPKTLEVVSLTERPRTVSERLIESFMLVANEVVAEHFKKLNVPFVYRVHEAPQNDKIEAFNDFVGALGYKLQAKGEKLEPREVQQFMAELPDGDMREIINSVLLRSMQKAQYSSDCLGHFGLAAPYYCHFTSPIRRYPDLTIHRIIKDSLHGNLNATKIRQLKQFVVKASSQSSEREVLAQKAERDVDDYFKCRYMRDKIGEVFDATIDSVTNFGFFVKLDNTVEGLVSIASLKGGDYVFNSKNLTLYNPHYTFKLGDKVKVKLESVSLEERNIDFVLFEENIASK
ncbi:MAG: ribonuclease R [Christensenellales bacterium]